MTLKKSTLALTLALIIAVSFLALMQLQKDSSLNFHLTAASASNLPPNYQFGVWTAPTFSNQISFENAVKQAQTPIVTNATRTEVYSFIVANPGIQFRGICTGLCIAIGTAEFHLGVLKKAGLISFVRDGKYKRFFASKKYSMKEMRLISLLRHETIREILKTIAAEKSVSHCKLASNLSITSQGLTWQMNRLREEGVIEESWDGIKVSYSLNELNAQVLPELLCIVEQ